ncbi:MAG: hypothetical protein IKT70_00630 [Clostridia bacterium]|nr:hypothetical protein [Clostridia bacterium]
MTRGIKIFCILLLPMLLFFLLATPYSYLNQEVIVDRFGCGCPQIDEAGNMIEKNFNANTVTAIFWFSVTGVVTVISFFLSRRYLRDFRIIRLLYMLAVIMLSLFISFRFTEAMMWN